MDDDRRRFLLRHLPTLTDAPEPKGDIRALIEEKLIAVIYGKFELTEDGRRFLEVS
jgi:hypothetical protein